MPKSFSKVLSLNTNFLANFKESKQVWAKALMDRKSALVIASTKSCYMMLLSIQVTYFL